MRKWMTWMITWILFAAVLSACGKEADDKKLIPKPEKKQEADAETETKTETKTEANAEAEAETEAETTADVSQDENWDDFCGDWTLVGFEYSDSVDDIEPSIDNPYYDAENEWIVSDILIYDEENTLYADYSRIGYENELRYCEQESWRETGLEHVMICTYLRKDSKEMEQKKEYQYVDEVTVSTVQELDDLMIDAENAFYRKQGIR